MYLTICRSKHDELLLHHCHQIIARLANYIIAALEDDTFILTFLPDDETSLTERVTSLAEWSISFGAGGANKFGDEFIRDLVQISKVESASENGTSANRQAITTRARGITLTQQKELQRRRKKLMDLIGSESIAIIPTASVYIRNRDVEFPFRPDSNFYYLTAYPEPETVAVLIPDRAAGEYILFCRERDAKMEIWHGRRTGLEGACDIYGADDAFPIDDMDDILPGLIDGHERIFYNMGHDQNFDHRVLNWVNQIRDKSRSGAVAPDEFISLNHFLHEMRLYKSREEIKFMRKAAKIAAAGHCRAMRNCKPGMHEYQVEAELNYEFMRHGSRSPAYPSIVGAGANSCILHYTQNSDLLHSGDLLLIDAGAEYKGYASDITRTFPVNGEFSAAQRQAYDLVLQAQLAAIEQVKPGNHWNEPHDAAVRVLTEGMVELGILKGVPDELLEEQTYTSYYMHRTGHWLGMDVHDVGDYKLDGEWRMLEPGMVLTVEPGLYMPANSKGLAKKWWDIGIRIEDDVLVTKQGHEVLSKDAPKEADDIMKFMCDAA